MNIYYDGKYNVPLEEVPLDLKKITSSISAGKFDFDKYEGKKYQKYNRSPVYVVEYWDEEDDEEDYWHFYSVCYKTYELKYCVNDDILYITNYGSSTVPRKCIA